MLLDPSEEQLDAPTHLVKHGHGEGRYLQIVCEEDQVPCGFRVIVAHFPQEAREGVPRFCERGLAHMIASQTGEAIHRNRVMPGELQFALGPRDEEGACVCNEKETGKVHVAAIHQIERSGFEQKAVEPTHVVLAGSGDVDAGRNRPAQVDLGVHFDARLGLPEVGPREECQREIDGGRIEGVDRVVQIQAEIFPGIQLPGLAHETLGKVLPEPPVALFVGIRESGLRNGLAESQMMQSRRSRIQTGGDVPQSLAPGQLGEDHADELLATTKVADTGLGVVAFDRAVERLAMDEIENLGEDEATGVHVPAVCRTSRLSPKASHRFSSAIHSSTDLFKDAFSC